MKVIEVVAAAIFNNEGHLLITQRTDGEFKGLWEFPGGKIESGETHEQALMREIKEELSLTIAIDDFVSTIEYDYSHFHLIMHTYKCHIIDGQLTKHVHSDVQWIERSNIDSIQWVPADIRIAQQLK